MDNLFTFGCSYTDSFENNMIPPYVKYKEYKGYFPRTWNDILSEKMNLNLINYGVGGSGNDFIFQKFLTHLDEFKSNDVVIVQWSYNTRFKWTIDKPDGGRRWIHNHTPLFQEVLDYFKSDLNMDEFSRKFTDILTLERGYEIYMEDIINYEKIINEYANYKGFKVFFWDGDYYDKSKILFQKSKYLNRRISIKYVNVGIYAEVFRRGGQTISMETKGLIDDGHLGESGHKILSEILYEEISTINYNRKKSII
jgi:hypothetical protein